MSLATKAIIRYQISKNQSQASLKKIASYTRIFTVVSHTAGLPLLTGCEIQGLFQDFPGALRTNSRTLCTKNVVILYINPDLLLGKNRASVFVFIHCYIEGVIPGYDKQLSFIIFYSKRWKIRPFQDFQGPQPKFKDFPGPGIFFCQFQDYPGFSRTVATLSQLTPVHTWLAKWLKLWTPWPVAIATAVAIAGGGHDFMLAQAASSWLWVCSISVLNLAYVRSNVNWCVGVTAA